MVTSQVTELSMKEYTMDICYVISSQNCGYYGKINIFLFRHIG